MKRLYTRDMIVNVVKSYDVRAKKLDDDQIDLVIDQAYAEMCTIVQAFSDEEVIPVQDFRDTGETKFMLDIEEDVNAIYDLYVTIEQKDSGYDHDIQKIRNNQVIWKDNRYDGRAHVDLSKMTNSQDADNVVLKYYFTPVASRDSVYMDSQTMLAFRNAIGMALYDTVHDVQRSEQKRAALDRTANAIIPSTPEDAFDPSLGHIFSGLVH